MERERQAALVKWLRNLWYWLIGYEPPKLPPPDYIGRPPTCENGVVGCAIKAPHSHVKAFMDRLKERKR